MDVESGPKPATPSAPPKPSHRCRNICILLMAIIVLLVVLIVILAFTVFKVKHPLTTVNSVKFKNLQVSLSVAPIGLNLNATLDVNLSVKNPNKVRIESENSTTRLNYRGEPIGEAPVPANELSAGETKHMNVTLTVLANRFLSNTRAYSDFLSGVLPLNTYTKIAGKVMIIGLFEVHVISTSSCDFNVFVSNGTVGNQQCRYRDKVVVD